MLIAGAPVLRYGVQQFATCDANLLHAQLVISSRAAGAQRRKLVQQQLIVSEMTAPSTSTFANGDGNTNSMTGGKEPVKKKRKWTRVGTPPRECQVCSDGAYGYNYGAVTCESCKAFFRRHLNKTDIQPCPGVNNCEMTKKTRKYCPSCRLKKCVQVGMRPEVNPLKRNAVKTDCDSPSAITVKTEAGVTTQCTTVSTILNGANYVDSVLVGGADGLPSAGRRQLCAEEFNRIRKICNMLVLTVTEPFSHSDLNELYVAEPSSPFQLCGIGEATLKRFVRFVKRIPEFCERFSFDEKIVILKKALFMCHIFNGVYSYDAGGRKVMLDDGRWKVIPRGCLFELLKNAGIIPDQKDMVMLGRWVDLNKALRERFPNCWQLITAALTLITMFSPDYYGCNGNSDEPGSSGTSNSDELDARRNLSIVTKLIPIHASYTLFIADYIAQTQAEQGGDAKQVDEMTQFCMVQLHDVRSITNALSDRIGFIIALDPASAINAIPLYYELKDH